MRHNFRRNGLFFITLCMAGIYFCLFANPASTKYQAALNKAQQALQDLNVADDDLQNLIEYMEYYASWYASVTPAPVVLKQTLSPASLAFIEQVKNIAKPFERAADRRRLGSSRLTQEGKSLYKWVINSLKKKKAGL